MGSVASVGPAPSPNDVFGSGIQAFGNVASDYIHNRGIVGIVEDVALLGGMMIGAEFFLSGEALVALGEGVAGLGEVLTAGSASEALAAITSIGTLEGVSAARTAYTNLSNAWSIADSIDTAIDEEMSRATSLSTNIHYNPNVSDRNQTVTNPYNQYSQNDPMNNWVQTHTVNVDTRKDKNLMSNLQRTGLQTTTYGPANVYSSYSNMPVTSFGSPEMVNVTPQKRPISSISTTVDNVTNLLGYAAQKP